MAGSFEEAQAALAEGDLVAIVDGDVREPGCGAGAHVDLGAGAGGQLAVAGDEVGMQMGFDDVLDLEVVLAGGVEVDFDVALGIDDGGDAFGTQHVGGVGQAAEVELLEVHAQIISSLRPRGWGPGVGG